MTVPVRWVSYHEPDIIPRGYWDQGLLERVMDRRAWRPPSALEYVHDVAAGRGAVVVVPAQHHAHRRDVERLEQETAGLDWVLLVLTGDECSLWPWSTFTHPRFGLWVMTPRPHTHEGAEAFFFGEGYHPDVPDVLWGLHPMAPPKPREWAFAGQVTHTRREELAGALDRLGPSGGTLIATPGFTRGFERREYLGLLASAKVAPCPSGPCTPDSFRLYEALEAGCWPLADATTPEGWPGFWEQVYGTVPFPVVEDWSTVGDLIAAGVDGWPANANRAGAWWMARKREMALRLDDDVRRLAQLPRPHSPRTPPDAITVLVSTSPIASHPDPSVLFATLDSIAAAGLEGCEVMLMCDGVRPEQEHRRADYEHYLREVVWACHHRWRNVLPVIYDTHLHQAEMTRRALVDVRTPLVLFVEHDTPLVGEIPWTTMARAITAGPAQVIRLHHEADVLEPHRYLMLDDESRDVGGVPLRRTAEWSQRPHLASANWYRSMLAKHFKTTARTMIEDRLYSIVSTPWVERHKWGKECRLYLYAPEGSMKRSTHLDGRAGEDKYGMTW